MRYEDARLSRETGSFWLRLRLLFTRPLPRAGMRPSADLRGLSDHQLEDIGLDVGVDGRRRFPEQP